MRAFLLLFILTLGMVIHVPLRSLTARDVPCWSECGLALCTCTPEPTCPLCDAGESVTKSVSKEQSPLVSLMLGVPLCLVGDAPIEIDVDGAERVCFAVPAMPGSCVLGVPAPPPRRVG